MRVWRHLRSSHGWWRAEHVIAVRRAHRQLLMVRTYPRQLRMLDRQLEPTAPGERSLSTPRALLALISGQVCLHSGAVGMRLAAPLYVLDAGFAQALVAPLLALFCLAPIVLAIPAGRYLDRSGFQRPLRGSVSLSVLGGGCAVLSTLWPGERYVMLCLAAVLWGAGSGLAMTTIQRTAGMQARDAGALRRTFSLLSVAHSFSTFIGPLCAGALIDHFGMQAAFIALGLLPLLTLLAARWVPDAVPSQPSAAGSRRPAWELLSAPALRRLIAVNLCLASSWDVHLFAVPILGHQRGFSASAIASVLAVFALAVAAIRVALPALARRYGEPLLLRAALVVVTCTFALYPFAASLWTMQVCAVCLGLALGTSQPMVMTMLHQITPESRHGEAIALRSMFIYGSGIAVPLGFGAAAAWVGVGSLFWMMAGLTATGSLISIRPRGHFE